MQKMGTKEIDDAWKNVVICWDYCQFTVHQGGYHSYIDALKRFNKARKDLQWGGLNYSSGYFKTVRGSRSIRQDKQFRELSF